MLLGQRKRTPTVETYNRLMEEYRKTGFVGNVKPDCLATAQRSAMMLARSMGKNRFIRERFGTTARK